MPVNRELIGKEYTQREPFPVTAAGAKAYADATGLALEGDASTTTVPPMYGVAFSFGALTAPMLDGQLGADLMRLVHGEQDMRFVRPVHVGDVITSTSKILDVVDKSTGEVVQVGITSKNQKGEVVLELRADLFIKGPRKKEHLAAEKQERAREEDAFNAAPPRFTSTVTVAADQSLRYAAASGDKNPIHTSDETAKQAGLPGIILHGLCTMAFVHNAVVAFEAGGDPWKVARLAVRFHRPVLMGDGLTVQVRGPAGGPFVARVVNQNDDVVLKGGVVELR
jgi:acyl dehydratase